MNKFLLLILFASSILLAQDAHFRFYPSPLRDSSMTRYMDPVSPIPQSIQKNSTFNSGPTWEAKWTGPKTQKSGTPKFVGMDEAGNTLAIYEYRNEINVQNIKIIKYAPDFTKVWIFDYNNAFGSDDWFQAAFVSTVGDITLLLYSKREEEGGYRYVRLIISTDGYVISETDYDTPKLDNFHCVFNDKGGLWFCGTKPYTGHLFVCRISRDGALTNLLEQNEDWLFPYIEVSNENHVILFLYHLIDSEKVISIIKMDSIGNEIWKITKPVYERINYDSFFRVYKGYSVDSLGNSYAFYPIMDSQKLNLIKISDKGTAIWEKEIGNHSFNSLSIDPGQNIYLSSQYKRFAKFSSSGNQIWYKDYEDIEKFSKIQFDSKSNFYIQGNDFIISGDSIGNIRWEYGESNDTFAGAAFYVKPSGQHSVITQKKVMFFSPNGQIFSEKEIEFPDYSTQRFIDMVQAPNGDFVILLIINWKLGLMRVDTLGNVLWSKVYNDLPLDYSDNIFNASGGKIGVKYLSSSFNPFITRINLFDTNGLKAGEITHFDDRFHKYIFANWQRDGFIHSLYKVTNYQVNYEMNMDRWGIYYERYDESGNIITSKILRWTTEKELYIGVPQAYIDSYGKVHFLVQDSFFDIDENKYIKKYTICAFDPFGSFEEIPIKLNYSNDGLDSYPFFISDNGTGIYTIFCDSYRDNSIYAFTSDNWDISNPRFSYQLSGNQYSCRAFRHINNEFLLNISYPDSGEFLRISKDFELKWKKRVDKQHNYYWFSWLTKSLNLKHIGLILQKDGHYFNLELLNFQNGDIINSFEYGDPVSQIYPRDIFHVPESDQFFLPIDKGNEQFAFVRFDANVPGNPAADKTAPIQLNGNYPNPFNGSSVIEFDLPESGEVEFSVYNILGQRVHQQKEFMSAGRQYLEFRQERLSSGTYIYRISQKGKSVTGKLLLIK